MKKIYNFEKITNHYNTHNNIYTSPRQYMYSITVRVYGRTRTISSFVLYPVQMKNYFESSEPVVNFQLAETASRSHARAHTYRRRPDFVRYRRNNMLLYIIGGRL